MISDTPVELGIQAVADEVTELVDGEDHERDSQPGKDRCRPGLCEVFLAFADHAAPGGSGGLYAEAMDR